MIHIYFEGIQRKHRYKIYCITVTSNRRFKAMTEAHGLKTEHIKTYGWMITHPTPELIECIQENGWKNFETFEIDVKTMPKVQQYEEIYLHKLCCYMSCNP